MKQRWQWAGDLRIWIGTWRGAWGRSPIPRLGALALLSSLLVLGCWAAPPTPPPVEGAASAHLLLGNPSNATPSPSNANNFLISRPQYALSYSRDRGIANWVSWQLNPQWLGDGPRLDFSVDDTLPPDWYRVRPDDYTGSGFDRGHLVPAADRNRQPEDSQSVFLMTNIFPQAPDNNQGPWNNLEMYCRELVSQGKELYILAGGAGIGGVGTRGRYDTIGQGRVVVPEYTWKVILVLDQPITSVAQVQAGDRAIAVILPNINGIRQNDWRQYRQSVDQVEQLTGYDFFSALPDDVETALEARIDDR